VSDLRNAVLLNCGSSVCEDERCRQTELTSLSHDISDSRTYAPRYEQQRNLLTVRDLEFALSSCRHG
jgi:hypothetical protein